MTVLKTWTSPLEHSVIIHVCARLEFPEVSAAHLTSASLDSTVSCLVLHQTLVFCLEGAGNGLWAIPTLHRPWLEATGCVLLPPAKCLAGRHYRWPASYLSLVNCIFGRPTTVHLLLQIFSCSWHVLGSPPYTCMEGSPSLEACLVSLQD